MYLINRKFLNKIKNYNLILNFLNKQNNIFLNIKVKKL